MHHHIKLNIWVVKGRNEEFLNLSIAYTVAMFKQAQIIRMFPKFLKPYVTTDIGYKYF